MYAFIYPHRLKLLGLKRLGERRIRADMLFVYKLLFGLTVLQADAFLYCVKSGRSKVAGQIKHYKM